MPYEYKTKRLTLKVLEPFHASKVLDYYLRNRSFLEEWEPRRDEQFFTLPYQSRQLRIDYSLIMQKQLLRLWLFKKNDDSRIIGSLSFNNIVYNIFQSCHMGYKLDQEELNQGYMTEAILKGVQIIFNEYHLHRIEANIMPRNVRSLRVVEKMNFHNEGLARKYLEINGKWEDHVHMVLLNNNVE